MNCNINGISLAYTDTGQGVPLLLVHGYPLNRKMWEPQVQELSDIARVVAPDLRGHGDSEATPGPYSIELFADDLAALLDALVIRQKIVLCGLSMGGYITFAFYRKYAARLAGIILTATRSAADSPEARAARDQAAGLTRQGGVGAVVASMLPRIMAPATFQQSPELVSRVQEIMLATSVEGILGDLEALKNRPDSTPLLKDIRLPTLMLPGEQDQIVPLTEARAMQAAIPGSRLKVIPQAGHLPNLENPAVFNAHVREFLQLLQTSEVE